MEGPENRLRPLESIDLGALQALLDRLAESAGMAPRPGDAERLFRMIPQGASAHDKVMLGIFDATERLVGFIDLIRHFPAPGTWTIGWMTLEPALRGQGLGTDAFWAIRAWAASQGVERLRLSVEVANAAACRFWLGLGFERAELHAKEQGQIDAGDAQESKFLVLERAVEA